MADFPAELSTGMVNGRFIVAVIDGEDEGQEPDVVPAQGKVAFKASVGYIPVPVATGGPVTVMKGPIMGVLDSEGYLCTPNPATGEPMYRGVRLVSTDDPDMAVTDWTWSADYRLEAVNGNSMQIPAHSFALPSGSELDLTTLVKVPSSPGYGLPQAEAAVLRAEAIAQSVRDDADNGVFDGATGPQGPPGVQGEIGPQGLQGLPGNATMRVDTTVGTRVFITDGTTEHMISGYIGPRNVRTLWGGTGGNLTLTRWGNLVELAAWGIPYIAGSQYQAQIPIGFRPPDIRLFNEIVYGDDNPPGERMNIRGDGNIQLLGVTTGAQIYFTVQWTTSDLWPTVLP